MTASMEKKQLMQAIAETVSAQENFPKKSMEIFCRLFFEVIEEGLQRDKFVKVKGFGTFKLVPVNERESIDVNTGERIQISRHAKVTFTPDSYIRDLVNKPFSHFQTIVLNEDTRTEDLDAADDAYSAQAEEEAPEQSDGTKSVEPASAVATDSEGDEENGQAVPQEGNDANEQGEDVSNNQTEPTAVTEEEAVSATEDSCPHAIEAPQQVETEITTDTPQQADTPEMPEDHAQVDPDNTQPEACASGACPTDETVADDTEGNNTGPSLNSSTVLQEAGTPIDEEPATTDEMPKANDSSTDDKEDADCTPSSATSNPKDRVKYIVEGRPRRSNPNWWRLAALTLFVIMLMGLCYFAGYYRILCPPCDFIEQWASEKEPPTAPSRQRSAQKPTAKPSPSVQPISNAAKPKKDSLTTVSPQTRQTPSQPSTKAENASPVPDNKKLSPRLSYDIVGTRSVHRVTKGENIYLIAARTYGHKNFASYIIRHNKLKDPDNIVVGSQLKLPELSPRQ